MQSSPYQPGTGKNCSGASSLGRASLKHLCVAHQCVVLLLLGPVTGSSPMPLLGGRGEEQTPWDFFRFFWWVFVCSFVCFYLKGRKKDIPSSPRTGPTKRDLKGFSTA